MCFSFIFANNAGISMCSRMKSMKMGNIDVFRGKGHWKCEIWCFRKKIDENDGDQCFPDKSMGTREIDDFAENPDVNEGNRYFRRKPRWNRGKSIFSLEVERIEKIFVWFPFLPLIFCIKSIDLSIYSKNNVPVSRLKALWIDLIELTRWKHQMKRLIDHQ